MIYRIDPKRTVLLIIDAQKEYFKEDGPAFIPAARTVLPHIIELRDAARKAGALVVYVQHVNRADGSDLGRMSDFGSPDDPKSFIEGTPEVDLVDELQPDEGEVVIQKRRYSCFLNTDLPCVLATRDINTVVITGYMTSFCCETTARDAHGRDYRVLFVRDAVEGPDLEGPEGNPVSHEKVLQNTLTALRAGFAEILTTKEAQSRFRRSK